MRQMEATKKEYIDKLKKELENVEERYMSMINQNCMVGEDYRAYAFKHAETIGNLTEKLEDKKVELEQKNQAIIKLSASTEEKQRQLECERMFQEEQLHSILKEHFLNNNLKVALRKSEDILDNKMKIIGQLNEELARLNSKKPPKQTDASTMT